MPSERVTGVLLSKTDMTPEEIAALSEPQAWRLVYAMAPPRLEKKVEVCFTGFNLTGKATLGALAEEAGLQVVKSVTRNLGLLVCGPNAGPKKLEKAAEQGTAVVDAAEFERFLETGEIS